MYFCRPSFCVLEMLVYFVRNCSRNPNSWTVRDGIWSELNGILLLMGIDFFFLHRGYRRWVNFQSFQLWQVFFRAEKCCVKMSEESSQTAPAAAVAPLSIAMFSMHPINMEPNRIWAGLRAGWCRQGHLLYVYRWFPHCGQEWCTSCRPRTINGIRQQPQINL